jgi:hypothetical protein
MSTNPAKTIRRTSSDLKSSATSRGGTLPHKTHMRLVCLEMERYRRVQERQTLLARAARCEERCAEIDAEVQQLMATLQNARPKVPVIAEPKPLISRTRIRPTGNASSITHSY